MQSNRPLGVQLPGSASNTRREMRACLLESRRPDAQSKSEGDATTGRALTCWSKAADWQRGLCPLAERGGMGDGGR